MSMNYKELGIKIGIHHSKGTYSDGWISHCEANNIPYKIVDAYNSSIIEDLSDCPIFLWHHRHWHPKDFIVARSVLFSLEQAGKFVYPDWKSGWHFDDKVGQKYMLEALGLPLIPSFVFYSKSEALTWAKNIKFPIVFKLKGGASSNNVKLVRDYQAAGKLINKCFGRGFRAFDPYANLLESWNKLIKGEAGIKDLIKAFMHFFVPFYVEKTKGRDKGYAYFQEFIPNCTYDIRVQLVGLKGYAMKRTVRKNDFRASGGGNIDYDGSKLPIEVIQMAQEAARKIGMQSMAIDILPYKESYVIAEVCYAFGIDEGELNYGYFNESGQWINDAFDPTHWMVDDSIRGYLEAKAQA